MSTSTEDDAKGSIPIRSLRVSPAWEEKGRIAQEWRSRELKELMPDLPRDEQLRLQNRLREHDRIRRRMEKKFPQSSPSSSNSKFDPSIPERRRDSALMPYVLDCLHHYNARHPGAEFDPVKPLMQRRVIFRGQMWIHINFWACGRTNSKMIKRFFAEIHYKSPQSDGSWDPQKPLDLIPIVEICTIMEEPLCQYRRNCGFCPPEFDILHTKGSRKFVCGNDKDRIGQRLEPNWPQTCERPFFHYIERGPI